MAEPTFKVSLLLAREGLPSAVVALHGFDGFLRHVFQPIY
jgi:hypothetical protein